MKISEKEFNERVYNGVIEHAKDLAKNNKKETAEQLLNWINKNFTNLDGNEYGSIRNVIQAAHTRATKNNDYEGIEALEEVFTNNEGKPLLI
ncbi:MAG: hypothetical protein IKK36_07745 [Bacteroidales bacterium]|nr:hypothetical protein [Bacteroidales bacterium]